jgi:hypothetical protein
LSTNTCPEDLHHSYAIQLYKHHYIALYELGMKHE